MPPGKQRERRLRSKRGAASAAAASEAQTGSGGSSASAAGAGGRSVRRQIAGSGSPALVLGDASEALIARGCDGSTVPYLEDVTRHFEQMRWPSSVEVIEIWMCVIVRSNLEEATRCCHLRRWPCFAQEIDYPSCVVIPCFANLADALEKVLHAMEDRSDDEDTGGSNGNEGAAAAATVEDNPQAVA